MISDWKPARLQNVRAFETFGSSMKPKVMSMRANRSDSFLICKRPGSGTYGRFDVFTVRMTSFSCSSTAGVLSPTLVKRRHVKQSGPTLFRSWRRLPEGFQFLSLSRNCHVAGSGYTAIKLLEPANKTDIGRLKCHGLGKHFPRCCEFTVADMTVGPMIQEIHALHGRETLAKASLQPVGASGMASDCRDRDLVGPHGCGDTNHAGKFP